MNPVEPTVQRQIIENYLDAYNRFDIEGMLAHLHPDIVFQNISAGRINVSTQGIEELRQLARQSCTLFSTRKQTITRFEPALERTTIGVSFEGTLAADLPNGMKKGETVRMFGRTDFAFQDDMIVRITDVS